MPQRKPKDRTGQVWRDGGLALAVMGPPEHMNDDGWCHPCLVLEVPPALAHYLKAGASYHAAERSGWEGDPDFERLS